MRSTEKLILKNRGRGNFESILREKLGQLVEDHERCLTSLREPIDIDFDNGEVAEFEDRSEAALMVEHLSCEIRAIDDALARLARGEYGVCISCHRRIARGRLAANPSAKRCVLCETEVERKAGWRNVSPHASHDGRLHRSRAIVLKSRRNRTNPARRTRRG